MLSWALERREAPLARAAEERGWNCEHVNDRQHSTLLLLPNTAHRQVEARLCPGKHPGNGPQPLDALCLLAAGGATACYGVVVGVAGVCEGVWGVVKAGVDVAGAQRKEDSGHMYQTHRYTHRERDECLLCHGRKVVGGSRVL